MMKGKLLSPLAALGLLFMILSFSYLILISPSIDRYLTLTSDIEQLEKQLSVYQRVLSSRETILTRSETDQPGFANASEYLQETRSALAAAQLQQRLTQMIGSANADLVSLEVNNLPQTDGPFAQVGLRVYVRADTENLVRLLFALETNPLIMLIDSLNIQSVALQRMARQASANRRVVQSQTAQRLLDVQFDLTAFAAKGRE